MPQVPSFNKKPTRLLLGAITDKQKRLLIALYQELDYPQPDLEDMTKQQAFELTEQLLALKKPKTSHTI